MRENVAEPDIDYLWEKIGGSAWEITQIISKFKNGESIQSACNFFIDDVTGKLADFCNRNLTGAEESLAHSVHKIMVENGFAQTTQFDKTIYPLISKMVEQDFWFYRSDMQRISANSESQRWAMQRIISR